MDTDLFDYALPAEAIAQRPTAARDGARLLEVRCDALTDHCMRDFAQLVPQDALVVANNTRVMKARLFGQRDPTGGKVELLLLKRLPDTDGGSNAENWSALGRSNRPLRRGTRVVCGDLIADVTDRAEDGELEVAIKTPRGVADALERLGHVPLPPYVKRPDDSADAERYQTVFARHAGSVAAPTAGLHFTAELIDELLQRGVRVGFATLHVGIGTFRPVEASNLDDHVMHSEHVVIDQGLCALVDETRSRGGPVIAIGTTCTRALESAACEDRRIRPFDDSTDLFIKPGYRFKVVDGLLTNFHMPRSTLLALVSAICGRRRLFDAYTPALRSGYRFLSYGDAMWLPPELAECREVAE